MNCRWIDVCPLRRLENQGKISDRWKREYCEGDFLRCKRYQLEENGVPHKDTMLPDGNMIGN